MNTRELGVSITSLHPCVIPSMSFYRDGVMECIFCYVTNNKVSDAFAQKYRLSSNNGSKVVIFENVMLFLARWMKIQAYQGQATIEILDRFYRIVYVRYFFNLDNQDLIMR